MSEASTVRVLGIDTSLRSTGVGVVEAIGSRLRAIEFGRIKNARKLPVSQCLRRIHEELAALIERTDPTCVAVEGAFFCKNARTAMVLGQARGVAINAGLRVCTPAREAGGRWAWPGRQKPGAEHGQIAACSGRDSTG